MLGVIGLPGLAAWAFKNCSVPLVSSVSSFQVFAGLFHQRVTKGFNDVAYGIGFALALPANWNGRFLLQGGGGLNGSVGMPMGAQAAGNHPALARGYAAVSMDNGHGI